VEFESTKTPVTGECDRPLRDITDENWLRPSDSNGDPPH
jgi:hypothetical protein